MRRYAISDDHFARIEHLLPGKPSDPGRTAADNRLFLDAVLWVARTGAPWPDLPERFGKYNSVFQRFNRWSKNGVWARVFEALQDSDLEWLMLDSTTVHDREGTSARRWCAKRGDPPKEAAARESLGRSRGGLTTKIHAACDALGNPLRFVLTPGQRHDLTQAAALLDGHEAEAVVADKGYDADWLVAQIVAAGAEPVIPPKANRTEARAYDANLYADRNKIDRNKIERLFNRLKHYRRVATRYEKLGRNYLSFVHLAAAMTLLL
jgi:transposase